MAAYVIVFRETPITDPDAIADYQRLSVPKEPTPGLKVLAAYGDLTALEGDLPDAVTVIEFPDVEMAKAWFFSPHYQAAVAARSKAATFRSLIVEGLPPSAV